MRALYLSYDGALDPLGRSQVVPYLEGLSRRGYAFDLVTFEKPARWADGDARTAMEDRLAASDIEWHPLRYRKRPPILSTLLDLSDGYRRAREVVEARRPDLIHARSYPAALLAWRLGRREGLPYVFDMRGLYAEERVEGGLWREGGLVYRAVRGLERRFLRDAAAVVTLTESSRPEVTRRMEEAGSRALLRVIPTCVDLERFRLRPAPEGPFVLAYLGSVGTWYLLDEMLELGRAVLDEAGADSRLRFLVNQEADRVRRRGGERGLGPERLEVLSMSHDQVPEALARVHATFFLIRPFGSKVASSATKFGESLAMGRPVAANPGVGDTAAILREDAVGVVVETLDEAGYRRAARELVRLARDPGTAGRCRRTAQERFSLAAGVEAYERIYREIREPLP